MRNDTKPRGPSSPYIGLDLLRGGAALMVVLYHARIGSFVEFSALPTEQQNFIARLFFASIRLGDEAVLAFFVLSGFLVGGQIIRKLQHNNFDLRAYAIDRATRILNHDQRVDRRRAGGRGRKRCHDRNAAPFCAW